MNTPDESDIRSWCRVLGAALFLVGGVVLGASAMRACIDVKQDIRSIEAQP